MALSKGLRKSVPFKTAILAAYPFYPAALGELELARGRPQIAGEHFQAALALARSPMERRFLEQCVHACASGDEVRLAAASRVHWLASHHLG